MTQPLQALPARERLLPKVLALALPVVAEQLLHSFVALTDTYLANNLVPMPGLAGDAMAVAQDTNRAASAAVGSVVYILWFVGLLSTAIGSGATALISRAIGARHKGLANAVCAQAVTSAVVVGVVFAAVVLVVSGFAAPLTGLDADAQVYFSRYLSIIGWALPFAIVLFASNACLRGAGDTITPMVAMVVVDLINALVSFSLVRGWFGLPALGFDGIAIGTAVGYVSGATIVTAVLLSGRGKLRLYRHRLRPHLHTLRRMFRIGLPAGAESTIQWVANFALVIMINRIDNASAAAHLNAIRLEAFSYLPGFGFAIAASALVGQSLGMGDPERARRCAHLSYALGGSVMGFLGVVFILLGKTIASLLSNDPKVIDLTGTCLHYAGVIQVLFAAALIYGSALRGAGDTMGVMALNLSSILLIRLLGAYVIAEVLGYGLGAIWIVLCIDLCVRGVSMIIRFRRGRWMTLKV